MCFHYYYVAREAAVAQRDTVYQKLPEATQPRRGRLIGPRKVTWLFCQSPLSALHRLPRKCAYDANLVIRIFFAQSIFNWTQRIASDLLDSIGNDFIMPWLNQPFNIDNFTGFDKLGKVAYDRPLREIAGAGDFLDAHSLTVHIQSQLARWSIRVDDLHVFLFLYGRGLWFLIYIHHAQIVREAILANFCREQQKVGLQLVATNARNLAELLATLGPLLRHGA